MGVWLGGLLPSSVEGLDELPHSIIPDKGCTFTPLYGKSIPSILYHWASLRYEYIYINFWIDILRKNYLKFDTMCASYLLRPTLVSVGLGK